MIDPWLRRFASTWLALSAYPPTPGAAAFEDVGVGKGSAEKFGSSFGDHTFVVDFPQRAVSFIRNFEL